MIGGWGKGEVALEGDTVDFHLWTWETDATFSGAITGGKCVFRSGGVTLQVAVNSSPEPRGHVREGVRRVWE